MRRPAAAEQHLGRRTFADCHASRLQLRHAVDRSGHMLVAEEDTRQSEMPGLPRTKGLVPRTSDLGSEAGRYRVSNRPVFSVSRIR